MPKVHRVHHLANYAVRTQVEKEVEEQKKVEKDERVEAGGWKGIDEVTMLSFVEGVRRCVLGIER